MKRVIVTGANGFVGSNIVSALIEQGWFVYPVDLAFDWQSPVFTHREIVSDIALQTVVG